MADEAYAIVQRAPEVELKLSEMYITPFHDEDVAWEIFEHDPPFITFPSGSSSKEDSSEEEELEEPSVPSGWVLHSPPITRVPHPSMVLVHLYELTP